MCDKVVNIHFVPYWYKSQEMSARVASEYHFLMVYSPDKYKT